MAYIHRSRRDCCRCCCKQYKSFQVLHAALTILCFYGFHLIVCSATALAADASNALQEAVKHRAQLDELMAELTETQASIFESLQCHSYVAARFRAL